MTGSSRFAVGVHMLAYLAFKAGAQTTSSEIAASVDTNPVVIRRLLSLAMKAGMVRASKGAGGGFLLARKPSEISLLQICEAMEPSRYTGISRFNPNRKCPVGVRIETLLKDAFAVATAKMDEELERVTLADIHSGLADICPKSKCRTP